MIGYYILDETPSVDAPLVLAHSDLNAALKCKLYVRTEDCKDISSTKAGSKVFAVADDASGFGVALCVIGEDVEANNMLLQHSLHVKENTVIDKNLTVNKDETVNGKIIVVGNIQTNSSFKGNAPTSTITLTAAHCASILAAGTSGTPPTVPLSGVQIMLS